MVSHMDAGERFLSRFTDRHCYIGGGTTTLPSSSSTTSQPWAPAQPYLQDIMGQAQSLYNQGSSYAPFSTVAPINPVTQQAMDLTQQRATDGSPVSTAANATDTSLMNGASPNAALPNALNLAQSGPNTSAGAGTLQSFANGTAFDPNSTPLSQFTQQQTQPGTSTLAQAANGGLQNQNLGALSAYANSGANTTPAQQYLSQMAQGGNTNPQLDQMFQQGANQIRDYTNAEFGLGGRTGSAANQDVLGRNLGNYASQLYGNAYNTNQANQLSAAGQIQNASTAQQGLGQQAATSLAGFGQSGISNQLGAANSLAGIGLQGSQQAQQAAQGVAGLQSQNAQNQLQAGNLLSQLGLGNYNAQVGANSAAGNLSQGQNSLNANTALSAVGQSPALANQSYTDLSALGGVGTQYQNQANAQLQDLLTRYQYGQQQPWNLLNQYNAAVQGFAGLGGQSQSTGSQTQQAPSQLGGIGSLLGGAGLLGSAFGLGKTS